MIVILLILGMVTAASLSVTADRVIARNEAYRKAPEVGKYTGNVAVRWFKAAKWLTTLATLGCWLVVTFWAVHDPDDRFYVGGATLIIVGTGMLFCLSSNNQVLGDADRAEGNAEYHRKIEGSY